MAYSPDGTTFYVASTFTTRGEVTAFDVDGSGLPVDGTGREIARLGNGSTPDGMAVDARGRVYVAANLQRRIARIDPATGQTVNVVTGLSTPASMAFGRGPGFDPCSIYVTSLSGPSVYRVVLDTPGAPVTYPTGG
jgi:sugar lactone lactonase YvrE